MEKDIRDQATHIVIGYRRWIDFDDVEPGLSEFRMWCLENHCGRQGIELDTALRAGEFKRARELLLNGPWSESALAALLRDTDRSARELSAERRSVRELTEEVLDETYRYGAQLAV